MSAVILDRGMAESGLHHLERQFEAAVGAAVDAPRGMEVPQRMEAAVFRAAVPIDDASGNLRRVESALDDTVPVIDAALAVGEGEAEFAVGTSEVCSRSTDKTIGGTNWPSCGPRARCRRGDTRSGKAFVSQCATETPCGDTQRQKALQQNAQFVLNRAASRRPAASVCRASQADRAVLERACSREPANRGLAHTVGGRPAASVCRASQADRAVLERAGSREPANRGLAHTVGARQIGLHSAVSEPLEGLLSLVGCQLDRAAEFHASGLGALAAIIGTSAN